MKRVTLNHYVAIYVPSRFGPRQETDSSLQRWLTDRTAHEFTDAFGGSTVTECVGHWNSDALGRITETVCRVCSFTDVDNLQDNATVLLTVRRILGAGQESVGVEIDGQLHLFSD